MNKFDNALVNELKEYWENKNSKYTRFSVVEGENHISVKRYDGHGIPGTLKTIFNNTQLKNYLNELIEVDEEYKNNCM